MWRIRMSCGGTSPCKAMHRASCGRPWWWSWRARPIPCCASCKPHVPEPILPDRSELEKARRIARASPCSHSALAMLGDKCLLFNENGDAFVMYQVRGSSWIAMGDPVGPENARESLARQFREICDTHGGRSIFYQVDADNLAMYVDMGLALLKLGEEALVPLEGFSLQAPPAPRCARYSAASSEKAAASRSSNPIGSPSTCPACAKSPTNGSPPRASARRASRWGVSSRHTSAPATARWSDSTAGSSPSPTCGPATAGPRSRDLMRYAAEAPKGTMDYLFTELFLWASAVGYQRFNLGMAPLSGLETHPLAPLWHRIGTLVYRHGDNFYNFEGLRAYKAKFKPEWRPKYLAAPRGLALPSVLLDISALISEDSRACSAASVLRSWTPAPPARHGFAPSSCRAACPFFTFFPAQTRNTLARRGETRPTGADRRQPENRTARIKVLDPGLRRGDESLPTALPAMEARPPAGNDEAEPAAQALSPERANRPGRDPPPAAVPHFSPMPASSAAATPS